MAVGFLTPTGEAWSAFLASVSAPALPWPLQAPVCVRGEWDMIGWELALSLSLCLCLYKIKSQSQSHKEGVKMDRHRMNFLGLIQAQAPLISPSLLFWLWCLRALPHVVSVGWV